MAQTKEQAAQQLIELWKAYNSLPILERKAVNVALLEAAEIERAQRKLMARRKEAGL